jgi:hypothetical protein
MAITFIGMGSRSSGKVRGQQLVNDSNNFYDTDTRHIHGLNKTISKNIIFVRSFNKNLASNLKNKGHTIGFDIIDRPVAELHKLQKQNLSTVKIDWSLFCDDSIDYYIVTNSLAKKELSRVTNKSIYVIPHHVVSKELVKNKKSKIKTLGYIGTKDQLYFRKEIIEYCNNNNLIFYENHPKDQNQCIEDLSKIDIGIILLEKNDRTDYVLKYKPNQKLSNFQCFGIPTVCTPYESYKEFTEENSCIFVTEKKEIIESLNLLVKNINKRNEIIKNGYISANKLLVKNVIKVYNNIKELK